MECDRRGISPKDLAQPIVYWNVWGNVPDDSYIKKGKPLLLFAGEGVSQNYFSTAHGAYLSGETQANVILNYKTNLKVENK